MGVDGVKVSIDKRILGINDNQNNLIEYQTHCEGLIKRAIESGLNLTNLVEIKVPYDYTEALTSFQSANGLKVGHSENGFGKVEHILKNGVFEHYIFIRKELFLHSLSSPKKDLMNLSLNGIYHELCHVHDSNIMYKHFTENAFDEPDELDDLLNYLSLLLWSEYFAHRKSIEVFPIEINLADTKQEMISYENEIIKLDGWDRDSILGFVYRYIDEPTRKLGEIHGKGLDDKELENCIKGTSLHFLLFALSDTLKEMYDTYPNWKEIKVVKSLSLLIEDICNTLGIYFNRQGNTFEIIKY